MRDQLGQELEELTASLFEVGLFTSWPRATPSFLYIGTDVEGTFNKIGLTSHAFLNPLTKRMVLSPRPKWLIYLGCVFLTAEPVGWGWGMVGERFIEKNIFLGPER